MTAAPVEDSSSSVVAFRDSGWKTRWVFVGLAVLLLWRCIAFVDREWLFRLPPWLLIILTGLVPQTFLLCFPILTRDPHERRSFGIPAANRCLIEFAIAVPVLIGTIVVLAALNYLVGRISPGSSLAPEAFTNMAGSPNRLLVYLLLLFSFTFAPVAEELFFRGFLQNAFRARMPLIFASLVQCLIFGFSHTFGFTHAGIAFALGLLLTALYEWRKTLIAPILVHAGINFVAALGMVVMMIANADSPMLGVIGEPNKTGCVIRHIAAGSAAEQAGLQVGDIITSFNGEPIRDFPHLVKTVRLYRPGDVIPVSINRAGSVFEVDVVLQRRSDQ